ncbi:MAG: hypothetical protein KDD51_05755 [Bdellovibrionales bacterium]|nr:hypothetical protein [Bdellovibrionales bacterium]
MRPFKVFALVAAVGFLGTWLVCVAKDKNTIPNTPEGVQKMIVRFSPTVLAANTSHLSEGDRAALEHIIEGSRYLQDLFAEQVWSENLALRSKLEADTSELGKKRLHYFKINMGPWSRLDGDDAFLPNVPEKPVGANFYPADLTKEKFSEWVATLSAEEQEKARGFFSVVRKSDSGFRLVSYSEEYSKYLQPAARELKKAAELTTNETLRKFLNSRAEAFLSDDYYESDLAWLALDAPIDVTIGPYETYEDQLLGYKAAFEAVVAIRDDASTAKLATFSRYLQELENNLPMPDEYKNPSIGKSTPIKAVDIVFSSGDARRGVMSIAFNLPNDEKVITEAGSKKVMMKNLNESKFSKILLPLAEAALASEQKGDVDFEAFFTHVLMHELVHGIGPHEIEVDGRKTTARHELKNLYSAIEEAKADVGGLWALQYLVDKGVVDKNLEKNMYRTNLASAFRSVRFGVESAHGRAVALQFNYYVSQGAILFDAKTQKFSVDESKIQGVVKDLLNKLLLIEAKGDYAGAKQLLDAHTALSAEMKAILERAEAEGIPVDLEPIYPLAGEVP